MRLVRSGLHAILVVLSCCLAPAQAVAEGIEVRYPVPPPPTGLMYDYFVKVLDLALSKTAAEYGPYTLKQLEMKASNPRLDKLLEQGDEIDVLLVTPNRERDSRLLPVRFPLDKGVLGYRILMIRQGDGERFAAIRTLDDFKRVRLGQGFDWEDWHILTAAGFDVEAGTDHAGLVDMLARGRFHGFPRGIYEIDNELEFHSAAGTPHLQAEATLMLHYKTTRIVYVNKRNTALAQRIEQGLRLALADGSFNHLFNTHPAIVKALRRADFANRRIFDLPNPRIPPAYPLDDPELWYTPPAKGETAAHTHIPVGTRRAPGHEPQKESRRVAAAGQ